MSEHYRDRFLKLKMGPVIVALARKVAKSVTLEASGHNLSMEDVKALENGGYVIFEKDLSNFMVKVAEIGGFETHQSYLDIKNFLPDFSEKELGVENPSGTGTQQREKQMTDTLKDEHVERSGGAGEVSEYQNSVHNQEPSWSSEHVVCLGDQKFDITDKLVRRDIVRHIRAAKNTKTFSTLLKEAGIKSRSTGWFSSVEKGTARITSSELEVLAQACDVPVNVLLTGQGLDPASMEGQVSQKKAPKKLSLPYISDKKTQDFFRERVLSRTVKLAEGAELGDLLEVAGNPDGADFQAAFLELTENGATVQRFIDTKLSWLKKVAVPIQVLVLTKILEGLASSQEGSNE